MDRIAPLSIRRQWVLKCVVEEHVRTAVPVSSDAIARRAARAVSPATVRNDLAYLEEIGLTTHPHTSAGRVPTDAGYRYFVERLMQPQEPTAGEQRTIQHQFHQVEPLVDRWAALATSILANAVGAAAVVTSVSEPRSRVQRLSLVPVAGGAVLLTVSFAAGGVRQQLLNFASEPNADELDRLAATLSARLAERAAGEVEAVTGKLERLPATVAAAIAGLLRQADSEVFDLVHYEGLSHVLAQPEFENSRDALPLVRVLEHRPALARLLSEAIARPGVRVIIGAEQPIEEMREASAVMATYGQRAGAQGVLGVLGPRRMPYWRAVAMVQFMANVMSLLVREAWSRRRSEVNDSR